MEAELDNNESWQYSGVFGFSTHAPAQDVAKSTLIALRENAPIGTIIDGMEVTGPYVRLTLTGFDSDVLEEDVLVVRSLRGFTRRHDVGEVVLEAATRSSGFTMLDFLPSFSTYYYTIFYKVADTWVFDPNKSFAKQFALSNYISDDEPFSKEGNKLFAQMPSWMQADDLESTATLYALCQIIGRLLDGVLDELSHHQRNAQSIADVDAGRIPYIDWLIAWPTNYEFPEIVRRRETKNALSVWRRKGARVALENVLQRLTGWNVTILEGWKWVIRTASDAVLPDDPPAGWEEETDGDWYELREQVPDLNTVGDERVVLFDGVPVDMTSVLPSDTPTFGKDEEFKNDHGFLVILTTTSTTTTVQEVVLAKLNKLLPILLPLFSTTVITFAYRTYETWVLAATDEFLGGTYDLSGDEPLTVAFDLSTNFFTPDVCDLRTVEDGDEETPGTLNDRYHWSPHSDLEYTCGDHRVTVDAPFGWYELGVTP